MAETLEKPPSGGPSGGGSTSGGGGSSSSSGGSSSSSGEVASSPAAPPEPQDPYDAWIAKLSSRDQRLASTLDGVYSQLWGGSVTPLAVLQSAVAEGLNGEEFADLIRRTPAWLKSDMAEEAGAPFDLFLSQIGMVPKRGKRGKADGKGPKGPEGDRYDDEGGFGGPDDGRPFPGGRPPPAGPDGRRRGA